MFNVNVKIINASLKFLLKVPTQKAKFYKNIQIKLISQTNFKSFSNQRSDAASILSTLILLYHFFLFAFLSFYMKQIFMLTILFKSHLIRHSGTGRAFKDTQRALEHLRHLESTWALGHLENTQRPLGHSGTWRAIGHLRPSGTWTLKALWHLGTWALEALYLADSFICKHRSQVCVLNMVPLSTSLNLMMVP